MKTAQAFALTSLVFLSLHANAADVAAAQKNLDAARKKVADAVAVIEKDPPSNADLDTAHNAVEALKGVIDACPDCESNDLDYAKSVLAARKEFRTQRAYVDQRRAMVHIFEQRRKLDAEAATVTEKANKADAKEAGVPEFEAALAEIASLRKHVEESKKYGKEDPKFGTYLGELEAMMSKREKAIDVRATGLLVAKQRGQLDEAKKDFTAAMGPLAKTSTDEQFKAADFAITTLNKRLEEGKMLEGKDAKYGAEAAKTRSEVAAAKTKMDALWSETGITRLKGEIEPARKDLQASVKGIRPRKPSPDAIAEARTAAIVVRKLLEKYEPESKHIAEFGKYCDEVRALLVDVEAELAKKNIDVATNDVNQALKVIAKNNPPDEAFEEANAAINILEKTIAPINPKDPTLGAFVFDAKALIRDARASTSKRRIEIDVGKQKEKVEEVRKSVATHMEGLGQPGLSKEKIQAAEAEIQKLVGALDAGTELTKKDREYAAYDREVRKRVTELGVKIAARKVTLSANDGRAGLIAATDAAKVRLEAAKQPDSTDQHINDASKAIEALNALVESQTAMEQQDGKYAAQANKARDDYFKLIEALERARQVREVRKKTVEYFSAGSAAVNAVSNADLKTQKTAYEKAIGQFKLCTSEGGTMVREFPMLSNAALLLDGRPSTPKEVLGLCSQQQTATEKLLKDVVPFLAFEEGPKKAYESAKKLVGSGKKSEALAQFDECIATGVILSQRSPELKERSFTVAGTDITLSSLVQVCTQQSKSLRGK